jgi:glucan biosynthesis protein C
VLEAYIGVWMTCVCLIAGRSLLNRGNAVLRYLADASYWIYIVHLPILFAIQYRLLDSDLPWGAKFAIAVLATFGLCLLSYHVLVRRTLVGNLLGVRAPAAVMGANAVAIRPSKDRHPCND